MRNCKLLSCLLIGLVLFSLTGCSEAPQEQVQTVQTAFAAAESADAAKYASESWLQAQDLMNQAQAEITAQEGKLGLLRSYGKSVELLTQAQAQADKAAQEAVVAKEQAKQETLAQLQAARAELTATIDLLATAPRGKDTKAEIESMQQELTGLQVVLDQADALVSAEDYDGARAQAGQVNTQVAAIQADLTAAIAKVGARR
jgi:hypothetical protein